MLKPSDLAERPDFRQGPLTVMPARRLVEGPDGEVHVEPLVMRVFLTLLDAGGAVVTRETLFDECWGGVVIGDDSLNRSITMVRRIASTTCPGIFEVENIPRTGYRLSGEILSFQAEVSMGIPGEKESRQPDSGLVAAMRPGPRLFHVGAALLVVAAIFAGLLYYEFGRSARVEAAPATIAVLPFRNLSAGDPYFAEGIGEEILGQLAREPQFRVAGRATSSEFGKDPDIREVARRLDVDYVLEGSVRSQGDRVRVNADLVRARDGIRLWSDSYDGKLDDIFAIQQRIGGDIAGALKRKLVRTPVLTGALVTNGEAYNLYLTARGLLRTRNRRVASTAASLLRDAINLDPGYAPAWAALAQALYLDPATGQHRGMIAAISKGQGYARHALRLAPDLAEAHYTLGLLLGYGTPEAAAHFRRAAELDPNSAENMLGLGLARDTAGEFDKELAAYRRAIEIDPLWFRAVGALGIALAQMGDRGEAEAITRRGFAKDINNQHILLGRIAWILGDYSEAIRRWSIVARANSPRWSDVAQSNLKEAKIELGFATLLNDSRPARSDQPRRVRVKMNVPPVPVVWRARSGNPVAVDVYRDDNHVAAKLMLNAGRAPEIAAAYDRAIGLFGIRPRQPLRVDQLHEVPVVVLALRQAGRAAEADRLAREADAVTRAVYRRSRVPFWFDADAAALFALEGRNDEALSTLERAMDRGWTHSGSTDLRDIAQEPAFRSLHGHPRFERIRNRIQAHYARERAETQKLQI